MAVDLDHGYAAAWGRGGKHFSMEQAISCSKMPSLLLPVLSKAALLCALASVQRGREGNCQWCSQLAPLKKVSPSPLHAGKSAEKSREGVRGNSVLVHQFAME